MTARMAMAREAFEARAGHGFKVQGATYTWDTLPSGNAELAFMVSVGDESTRLVAVEILPTSDVVRAAADLGAAVASTKA